MGIGDRIKLLRGSILQDEFARRVNVHKNTVGRWEREQRKPDSEDLASILNAFPDINPTWLLTGEGEMKRGSLLSSDHIPSYGTDVHNSLDEALLQAVLEAVEEYLNKVGGALSPAKKAQLITTLYEMTYEGQGKQVDKATVIRLIKLAA